MAPRTDFYRVTEGISGRFRGLWAHGIWKPKMKSMKK